MRNQNTPIAREGFPFIAVAVLALTALLVFHVPWWLTLAWAVVTGWVVAFFRNPQRAIPPGDDAIVCPADGEVVSVAEVDDARYGMGHCRRVCIFMSPFNVHINRVPLSGVVVDKQHHRGRFLMASAEKASLDNEQCGLVVQLPDGRRYGVVQIAGMLARRIVSYPVVGDRLTRGGRFGLIRFGSRVDLYLPTEAEIAVTTGDRVFGGATTIGRLPDAPTQ